MKTDKQYFKERIIRAGLVNIGHAVDTKYLKQQITMEEPKNKIGIICDNYKVRRFKAVLEFKGYKYEVLPMDDKPLSVISVDGAPEEQQNINKICQDVECFFQVKKN